MKRLLVFLIPALLLLGSSAALAQDYGSGNASNGGADSSSATIMTKKDKKLGTILADAKGMTVYLFTNDTKQNESTCYNQCAKFWPPVTATGDVSLASGIDGTLTTFDRADGTKQVAYNGIPLYYFAQDKDPGDAYGEKVGGNWFVVKPGQQFGEAKPIPVFLTTKQDAKLGTILADAKGMTVYMFTKDTKGNESVCTDKCATNWPPVTAKEGEDLILPAGVQGTLKTFKRADGTLQVSYNGMPLYYFAKDEDKEDAYGQGVGSVWFVIAPGQKFGAAPDTGTPVAASPEAGNGSGNASAGNGSASANSVAVEIKGFAYNPATVEVAVGTTVTWTNNDSTAHTVTADDGSFQSGTLDPGKSFSFTFTKAGSVSYHCEFHPNMTATVTVK
jgi:predicted lipoprotein with Yx(FWY)xxD motif/plastocyanin